MDALAYDLGASNGRAVVGHFDGDRIAIEVVHRFHNRAVQVKGRMYWDILRIFDEMKEAMLIAKHKGIYSLQSMGIDTWGVDFGLLDSHGELLANPYSYRDHQNDGMIEKVTRVMSKKEIFSRTGIQFIPINTLNQLYAMRTGSSSLLDKAESLLLIPGLLRYFFTGEKVNDHTHASTTQLVNIHSGDWDEELLGRMGIPAHLFAPIVQAGTAVGSLLPSVSRELGLPSMQVIAVGEHDTASAVAAVPVEQQNFAYICCGTWSLLGTEVTTPVLTEQALEWNFTNEAGVSGTTRLLKNIMGLWLVQECKRIWEKEGVSLSYEQMTEMAERARPFGFLIDPDHDMFLNPDHMPQQVQHYCRITNQPVPQSKGEIVRCILESLALKYRWALERTEKLAGTSFPVVHMVGGGIKNRLLCQFTANATTRPVLAGPSEASTLGNLLVQYMALGKIKNLQEARSVVKHSYPVEIFEPQDREAWNEAFERFQDVIVC